MSQYVLDMRSHPDHTAYHWAVAQQLVLQYNSIVIRSLWNWTIKCLTWTNCSVLSSCIIIASNYKFGALRTDARYEKPSPVPTRADLHFPYVKLSEKMAGPIHNPWQYLWTSWVKSHFYRNYNIYTFIAHYQNILNHKSPPNSFTAQYISLQTCKVS